MAWVLLIVAVGANVVANLAFKRAMNAFPDEVSFAAIGGLLLNPFLWVGGLGAGLLLGCYLLAIRELNLSVAYAFATSMSLVGITIAAAIVYREALSFASIAGVALVVAGISLISFASVANTQTAGSAAQEREVERNVAETAG